MTRGFDGSEDPVISREEACALLSCGDERLAELIRCGDVPATKDGKEYVIPRAAFIQRLNERAIEQAAARRSPKAPPAAGAGRRRPLARV